MVHPLKKASGKNNQNAAKQQRNMCLWEALSNGDKILSENYLQHSEHFSRILISQENSKIQSEQLNENSLDNHVKIESETKKRRPNSKILHFRNQIRF